MGDPRGSLTPGVRSDKRLQDLLYAKVWPLHLTNTWCEIIFYGKFIQVV